VKQATAASGFLPDSTCHDPREEEKEREVSENEMASRRHVLPFAAPAAGRFPNPPICYWFCTITLSLLHLFLKKNLQMGVFIWITTW